MAMVRYTLDPANPPKMSDETKARLDNMTEEEIEANALSDPDNPPITDEEFDRAFSAALVKAVRTKTGLSQAAFAERFHISPGRLRDLEQGRTTADSALAAYFKVIGAARETVERVLAQQDRR